ncbi:hypothetical protein AVEN_28732-1 [Araneus ventricosus]|uniref:Uncharacterized protein n=1 Tax=Araneus ventricosus TaxID=182803 RepID=A0A4Y2VZL9_ARAVE|nr:hypothetical protein AVEN_28732-1 [Araneus ventricosus]
MCNVAAFTTAHARLKLYREIEKLGESVLYYDTDSIIYASNDPEIGNFLEDFTDELEGDVIVKFVSGHSSLVVRSRLRSRWDPGSNLDSLTTAVFLGLAHVQYVGVRRPYAGGAWKFGEGGASSGVLFVMQTQFKITKSVPK